MLLAMLGGLLSVVALTITFFLTDRSRWRKVLFVIGIIGIALSSFQAYRSQERAAALQTKLNARTLTKQQFDALQQLKGRVSKINVIYETAVEPSLFASQIITALVYAGVDVKAYPPPSPMAWTGNMIYWKNFANDPRDDPLVGPFIKADLYGGHGEIDMLLGPIPKDAPLLMIGERYAEMNGGVYIPPAKK